MFLARCSIPVFITDLQTTSPDNLIVIQGMYHSVVSSVREKKISAHNHQHGAVYQGKEEKSASP